MPPAGVLGESVAFGSSLRLVLDVHSCLGIAWRKSTHLHNTHSSPKWVPQWRRMSSTMETNELHNGDTHYIHYYKHTRLQRAILWKMSSTTADVRLRLMVLDDSFYLYLLDFKMVQLAAPKTYGLAIVALRKKRIDCRNWQEDITITFSVCSKTNNFRNVSYILGRNLPPTTGKSTGTVPDPTLERIHVGNVQKLDCSEWSVLN